MKIIEIAVSFIFGLGLTFKVLNWPGSSLFIVLSLTILSYYYFIFSFAIFNNIKTTGLFKKSSYKNISPVQIIFSILLGMALTLIINGITFQIQKWTSEISILIIGLITSLIMLVLYYIFLKKETKNWKAVYLRSFIVIFVGLAVSFIF